MANKEEIYQRYLAARGDCQKYKDIIDHYTYLHRDEQISELSVESITQLKNAIHSLQELINSEQDLSIDKKWLEMAIEEGNTLLGLFSSEKFV